MNGGRGRSVSGKWEGSRKRARVATGRRERDDRVEVGETYDKARGCDEGGMMNEGGEGSVRQQRRKRRRKLERDIGRGRSCRHSPIDRKLFT
ncbi:hypothetical protein BHE74_00049042 [Ensete ventricosum]|nr:hypothetical protein GW17_00046905 [Ensete ventricosum]RWW45149.1 hypothetical protein BHE74_00049042 [Ensete ventricosum]